MNAEARRRPSFDDNLPRVFGARAAAPLVALAALLGAVASLPACKNSDGQKMSPSGGAAAGPPLVLIDTGARQVAFHVELALTPDERERGLMYRERLAPDAGMLFVFDQPAPLMFWMKNTLIPLDMIFIGSDRRIVGIVANAEPRTLTSRRVSGLSLYVLEIGGGLSARLGIRAGQRVELRNVPTP
jgi:uncharacterized protein